MKENQYDLSSSYYELPLSFSKLTMDWTIINQKYMSMFLKSLYDLLFVKRNEDEQNKESMYNTWLADLDDIFGKELRSNYFTSVLEDYLKSLVKFRRALRNIGFPADYQEMLFYNMKKNFLDAIALSVQSPSAYHYSTSSEVVYSRRKIRLLHYTSGNVDSDGNRSISQNAPILIVYSHINKANIMDISYDRSVVRNLKSNGLDVYMLDWGYSGREDDTLSIEEYIHILGEAADLVRSRTSRKQISILGYCWGGILSLIFVVLNKPKVESVILLATPVDFSKDNSLLSLWAKTIDTII